MSAPEYWFARRFPVGHRRNAMAPINRKGIRAFYVFAGTMAAGGIVWVILSLTAGLAGVIIGVVVFVGASILAAWRLFAAVARHGDTTRTVEDYRRLQQGSRT